MNLDQIRNRLDQFAAVRNWDQFHTPKNLSMALAAEDVCALTDTRNTVFTLFASMLYPNAILFTRRAVI